MLYQTGALLAFVKAAGGELRHIKPHGALYHQCGSSSEHALAVARAAADLGGLAVYGQAGSQLLAAAASTGLPFVAEGFADRIYTADGSLADRSLPGAVLHDPQAALRQARSIALESRAETIDGGTASVRAGTLCLHGDAPGAELAASTIRAGLEEAGVIVAAPKFL